MQRTHVYLPDKLNIEIGWTAKTQRKSKAEVIRTALEQGLIEMNGQKSNSAKTLLEMARQAKQFKGSGPKDLSINHDHYIWGGAKRDPKARV